MALRLFEMDTPILAVINGAAAGVGLTLAAACDIRLAAAGAKMTTAYARVGRSGDYGTTFFLGRLVGPSRARELMFTADVVNAEQALGIGLVDHVYPAAELLEKSYALAGKIASGPPRAIARMKRMFRVAEEGCLARFLDAEAESHIIQGCSLEGQEFLARFQASRSQK
ncbi:MAG: enoyl-CoA hydratase/isomerase family protein [Hyphomicrobium sp.]|nr:enoyl-CoA hydratase/isomerase family protein [Hyphomicrobium sp.]